MFFAKEPSNIEVINDLNGELINFYQTTANQFEEPKKQIETTLHSRSQYQHTWYIYNTPDYFSKVERAWALFVLTKLSFASEIGSSFGFHKNKNLNATKLRNAKQAFDLPLKERLEATTIGNDDACTVLKRFFDNPEAFHFIVPPYLGTYMSHYGGMFNNQSLISLLDLCANLKGKFMLTMFPNQVIKAYVEANGWVMHEI